MPNATIPPGVTVVPLVVTLEIDLPLADELAGNFPFIQQWVADHLHFSASLAPGVRALAVMPRGAGILRKGRVGDA